mgnify:FL=1
MAIESPYELLELADGASLRIHVERWEEGTSPVTPRDGRPAKVVRALRLHVPRADKAMFPWYWDLTSQTLIAQLLPMLPGIRDGKRLVVITKRGTGPSARFAVAVVGVSPAT